MNYSTYWSVLDTPSKSIESNTICLWVAIVAAILWLITKKNTINKTVEDRLIILWVTSTFTVIGVLGYVSLTFFYPDKTYEKTVKFLNSKSTPRVEGVVSNFKKTFRKTKYGGETIEIFSVDSINFAYSDALIGKFNSFTKTYNNVIYNGRKVRITYRSDEIFCEDCKSILKLEINSK
ncbi:MAG: hypothetical protein RL607_422 [Bacteroidota bacterium]|jgi:hypothetical protein